MGNSSIYMNFFHCYTETQHNTFPKEIASPTEAVSSQNIAYCVENVYDNKKRSCKHCLH